MEYVERNNIAKTIFKIYTIKMDGESEIEQFVEFFDTGVKNLAHEMEKGSNRIGVGQTENIPKPITDSFGTFTTRKEYFLGCDVGKELDTKNGVVVFKAEDGDITRLIEIGKTPDEYNPNKGGRLIADAGNSSDWLMAIRTVDKRRQEPKLSFRYVDREEIDGVVVKKGKTVSLNSSPGRSRQISVQGHVTSVASLY